MKENDLIIVKSGLNVEANLLEHWHKEILKQKETGVIVLPWFLEAVVIPEDMKVQFDPSGIVLEDLREMSRTVRYEFVDNKYPIYICDRDKSPCKNSAICYKPGGCFYTTDKDRALDPYMTVYKVDRFKKVKEGDKNE